MKYCQHTYISGLIIWHMFKQIVLALVIEEEIFDLDSILAIY